MPAPLDVPELLSRAEEVRVFRRLRAATLRNALGDALERARLRVVLVVVLTVVFWWVLFVVSAAALGFLNSAVHHPATRDEVLRGVFGVFFASLTIMLVFSTGIVLYGLLFHSRETDFLLTTPARTERVFLIKLHESILLSSWGFVLLSSPLLIAFGLSVVAPWYYYLVTVPLVVGFAYVPGTVGGIACLAIVRFLPRGRMKVTVAAVMLAVVVLVRLVLRLADNPSSDWMTPSWFHEVVGRLHFSEHRLLPSWWLCAGLLHTARGQWADGAMFLALIVANALFGLALAEWAAASWLREAFGGAREGRGITAPRSHTAIDALVTRALSFLPLHVRLLIEKDVRLFRRDPVQFLQFLIFFGLLGLYFVNVRRFQYDMRFVNWVNIVGFLNLAVVGLILATFTSRFVFPMMSLEGRRFWILGQLPIRRDTILWSKYWSALVVMFVLCATIVVASDAILRLPTAIVAVHLFTCVVLCTGLAGIAVGLGARLPNLTEASPSKIAAGFGGTLTLVISSLYIVAVVSVSAIPSSYELSRVRGTDQIMSAAELITSPWVAGGVITSVALAAVSTWLPMRLGLRAFRRLEF